MGTVTALSFCTVMLLFQPAAPISQTQLGKPGQAAPSATVQAPPAPATPAAPAAAAPAPQPAAVPAAAPAAAVAQPAPSSTGGRVAAFWVLLPN